MSRFWQARLQETVGKTVTGFSESAARCTCCRASSTGQLSVPTPRLHPVLCVGLLRAYQVQRDQLRADAEQQAPCRLKQGWVEAPSPIPPSPGGSSGSGDKLSDKQLHQPAQQQYLRLPVRHQQEAEQIRYCQLGHCQLSNSLLLRLSRSRCALQRHLLSRP